MKIHRQLIPILFRVYFTKFFCLKINIKIILDDETNAIMYGEESQSTALTKLVIYSILIFVGPLTIMFLTYTYIFKGIILSLFIKKFLILVFLIFIKLYIKKKKNISALLNKKHLSTIK